MVLSGSVAVVTGASGIVGSGMARGFLEAGATVVAPARSPASQARVQAELGGLPAAAEGRLHVPLADHGSVEGAAALAQFVAQLGGGRVDHVVSIAGGMAPQGTLTEATPETLATAVDSRVAPHLWLAKALLPLLADAPGSSYTVVTGMLGEVCPWPQAALTALTNAAVFGATLALQAELKGRAPRCNELRICTVVRRDSEKENPTLPGMPAVPSSAVAALAVGLAAGQQRDQVKQFKTSGIQLDSAALARLVREVQDVEDPEDYVHAFIEEVETTTEARCVTAPLLEKIVQALAGRAAPQDAVQVVDAFSVPHIVYDPVRKIFHRSPAAPSLQADAKSKVQLYVNRFHIVQQRLRRNKLFRPAQFSGLGGGAGGAECELTELKALMGTVGEQRYVMGFLTQPEEGRYAIEDLSARLPVDLSGAEQTLGVFTQNCIVVAEGELRPDGVFRVNALGQPPPERRADSLRALQGLDFFGGTVPDERALLSWEAAHASDRIVLLSDVWLDHPEILDRLHTVFAGFSQLEQPPSLFALMGPFQSGDGAACAAHYPRLREHFAALGRIINQYPTIRASSKFVLVPGPDDLGPGSSLPRAGLPHAVAEPLLAAVPNAVLASNPCRLRHGGSEIILFRDNLQQKMRGLAILPPPAGDEAPLFEHVAATVLQQSHLCPVPLEFQPVYWEHDHALFTYPLPDALVLADSAPAAVFEFDSCSCLNPGSLAAGTFAAYSPVTREAEVCDVQPMGGEDEEEVEEEEVEEEAAGGMDLDAAALTPTEIVRSSARARVGSRTTPSTASPSPRRAVMAHDSRAQKSEALARAGSRSGGPPLKKARRGPTSVVLPGFLHAHLQSRHLITSMRLKPAAGGPLSARPAAPAAGSGGSSSGAADGGPRSAPAAVLGGSLKAAPRTYVPVRTLPLIFAQRKRHLQQHKAKAQHAAPYQRRAGEGLLALPEDVLLKVVCLLTHGELKPLFQVCHALRSTLCNAVFYHFNYSTPSRPTEEAAPPALGERQRRPARTNMQQVAARLARGPRQAAGRGSGGSARVAAPRALDFDNGSLAVAPAVASRA